MAPPTRSSLVRPPALPIEEDSSSASLQKAPTSVAIIMDGNGRWAKSKGMPRLAGHVAGARTVDRITEASAARGVRHLALYAFSTENWRRPPDEVAGLWRLLLREIKRREAKLIRNGIRLRTVGRRDRMPADVRDQLARVEERTGPGPKMTLWLALDYGGQWDICGLVEEVRRREREGGLPALLSEEDVAGMLPSGDLPPVDLLVRTAGERRLSNFLPWQLAYSEFHFTEVLWPDFGVGDLEAAFRDFALRNRRYGAVT